MKIIVKKEAPFQVTGDSIAISPSNEGYELYFSADGLSYTSTGKVVPANTAFQYKAKTEGLFYKLVGNDSDVTVSFIKDCGGGGGGAIDEDAPEDGNIYGRKDAEWTQISASFEAVVVDELPTASADTMGKMYFVPQEETEEGNISLEYITIRIDDTYQWEQIGSTAVDLSGYYTKEETDTIIEEVEHVVAKAIIQTRDSKEDKIDYIIFEYPNGVWTQKQLDFIFEVREKFQTEPIEALLEMQKRIKLKNANSVLLDCSTASPNAVIFHSSTEDYYINLVATMTVGEEYLEGKFDFYTEDEIDRKFEENKGISISNGIELTQKLFNAIDNAVINSLPVYIISTDDNIVPAIQREIVIDDEFDGYYFEGIYTNPDDEKLYKAYTEIKQSEIGNDIVVTVEEIETGGGESQKMFLYDGKPLSMDDVNFIVNELLTKRTYNNIIVYDVNNQAHGEQIVSANVVNQEDITSAILLTDSWEITVVSNIQSPLGIGIKVEDKPSEGGMDEDTERTIANAIGAIPILKDGYAIKIENNTLTEPFRWTTSGSYGFLNIKGYNDDTSSSLVISRGADIYNSHSCIACGFGSKINDANNSFALGSQAKTNRDSQLACGSSNVEDNTKMFIVGNGEWNTPNTAFSVGKDGNSYTEHSSIAEDFVNTDNQKAVVADATDTQLKIWTGTEEEYEELGSWDNNTIYMIKEE